MVNNLLLHTQIHTAILLSSNFVEVRRWCKGRQIVKNEAILNDFVLALSKFPAIVSLSDALLQRLTPKDSQTLRDKVLCGFRVRVSKRLSKPVWYQKPYKVDILCLRRCNRLLMMFSQSAIHLKGGYDDIIFDMAETEALIRIGWNILELNTDQIQLNVALPRWSDPSRD